MTEQLAEGSAQPAEVWCVRAGLVPYMEAWECQRRLAAARQAGEVPDVLLLLEHPPVYTRGRRSEPADLPMGEEWYRAQGIEVCDTDRGGKVTYHGPGQLVGYPIVSLRPYRDDVVAYVRRMEQVIVGSLAAHGVAAGCVEGLTGVWTPAAPPPVGRKIASIGVHVSRGVTTHGFAINVNNDLQPFEWVVPCGLECRMSSLCRELGGRQDLEAFAATVCDRYAEVYERRAVDVPAARLAAVVPGLEALGRGEVVPVR